MTLAAETDKLANAKAQGQAQFDSIREMVEALQEARGEGDGQDRESYSDVQDRDSYTVDESAVEEAERAIHGDPLSVEVRGPWVPADRYHPQSNDLDTPAEYRILLCAGGPAVQIVGELSEHGEPETARMQVQDWFTPWTDFLPNDFQSVYAADESQTRRERVEGVLLAYARCFYFGE